MTNVAHMTAGVAGSHSLGAPLGVAIVVAATLLGTYKAIMALFPDYHISAAAIAGGGFLFGSSIFAVSMIEYYGNIELAKSVLPLIIVEFGIWYSRIGFDRIAKLPCFV